MHIVFQTYNSDCFVPAAFRCCVADVVLWDSHIFWKIYQVIEHDPNLIPQLQLEFTYYINRLEFGSQKINNSPFKKGHIQELPGMWHATFHSAWRMFTVVFRSTILIPTVTWFAALSGQQVGAWVFWTQTTGDLLMTSELFVSWMLDFGGKMATMCKNYV